MCTLAVYTRSLPGLPLVVAANRDEFYARPATGPLLLAEEPRVLGGRDLVAGGSWLCVSERELVVGVLNRRTGEPPDPARASRGALCLELARASSAAEAAERLADVPPRLHNPFNVLVADRGRAFVAQNRDAGTVVEELPAGTHLLTNLNLNDSTCSRISRSARRFAEVGERFAETGDASELVGGLRAVLADHLTALDDRQPTDQLCIHTALYGTRSSTILLAPDVGPLLYLHASGPPCRRPHRRIPLPWNAPGGGRGAIALSADGSGSGRARPRPRAPRS
ncbi:MAG TPA: NRDE family protein [Candidatus Binatia bacterium]|nr:NRDE family protein [Candidatus Binatia bacterium]